MPENIGGQHHDSESTPDSDSAGQIRQGHIPTEDPAASNEESRGFGASPETPAEEMKPTPSETLTTSTGGHGESDMESPPFESAEAIVVDFQALANRLIEAGKLETVVDYLDRFPGADHLALAHSYIQAGGNIAKHLSHFRELNDAIAFNLIEQGNADVLQSVLENLDVSFRTEVDRNAIAQQLIEAGHSEEVERNLSHFTNLSVETAIMLIEKAKERAVNEERVAERFAPSYELSDIHDIHLVKALLSPTSFRTADHPSISEILTKQGTGFGLNANLDAFAAVSFPFAMDICYSSITWSKTLDAGAIITKSLERLQGNDRIVLLQGIQRHTDYFSDSDRFRKAINALSARERMSLADAFAADGGGRLVADHQEYFPHLTEEFLFKLFSNL